MPNEVLNQLVFKNQSQLKEALKLCDINTKSADKNPKMQMDFNKLVPMPKILEHPSVVYCQTTEFPKNTRWKELVLQCCKNKRITQDTDPDKFFDILQSYINDTEKDITHKVEDLTRDQKQELIEFCCKTLCKFKDWYDWSVVNWGCKWNASLQAVSDCSIIFTTPWVTPIGWLLEFQKQFSDKFILLFADEDTGNGNQGIYLVSPYRDIKDEDNLLGKEIHSTTQEFGESLWSGWTEVPEKLRFELDITFPKGSEFDWTNWVF